MEDQKSESFIDILGMISCLPFRELIEQEIGKIERYFSTQVLYEIIYRRTTGVNK